MESKKKVLLWCTEYDEETHKKTFQKVNFQRYLNMIVSNKYFPQFQIEAAKQISDKDQWNQKCWYVIQFFQCMNKLFDINQTDRKISFIDDKKLRATLGNFRLWIDLQRLYLISFLKLDKIAFQQARIFMSLYRTVKAFQTLFNQYQIDDFQREYARQIKRATIPLLKKLSYLVPGETKMVIDEIIQLIEGFVDNKLVINEKEKEKPYDKIAFQKITQSISLDSEVSGRLTHNIKYQENRLLQILVQQISKLNLPTEDAQFIYDPKVKMIKDFLKFDNPSSSETANREKMNKLLEDYQKKVKGTYKGTETVYSKLMKNGHNPFDENNYVLYGELLGIDMSNKNKYQNQALDASYVYNIEQKNNRYYDTAFYDNIKDLDSNCANIVDEDLAFSDEKGSDVKQFFKEQDPKVKQLRWNEDPDQSRQQRPENDIPKDYSNNYILKKDDEDQTLKQNLYNVFTGKKYSSEFMNSVQKKGNQLINEAPTGLRKFNYKKLQYKQQSKFDFLRRIITYQTHQQKLKKIIEEKTIPDYYPRFLEEIKTKHYNPLIHQQYIDIALNTQ